MLSGKRGQLFLYRLESTWFFNTLPVLRSTHHAAGPLFKRELLNKFANCIGAHFGHLILSGVIFSKRILANENYFQIIMLDKIITRVSNRGGASRIDARWPDESPVIYKVGDSKQYPPDSSIHSCVAQVPQGKLNRLAVKPVIIMSGVSTQCPSSQKKVW